MSMCSISKNPNSIHSQELIQEMLFKADSSIWGALLVGCNIHSNVKLGELAVRSIVNLDPYNSGAYGMLSNIYAASGKWKDVNRVRVIRKEKGIKEQIAYRCRLETNSTALLEGMERKIDLAVNEE